MVIADLLGTTLPNAIGGSAAVGGAGAFAFFVTRWFFDFVAGRTDKREVRIDNANEKAIKTLNDLLDGVIARLKLAEAGLADCQSKHNSASAEVQRLMAIIEAQGEIRQRAAVLVAANSIKDRDKNSA